MFSCRDVAYRHLLIKKENTMLDIKRIRENTEEVKAALKRRGTDYSDKIDEILALKEQLGLINVYFTGRKENPYPYYDYADVVILPSENEAAPLVVSEAIILKKALIATNVGSVAEMLDHSKYGLLIPSSEDGIFEGMKQMLSSPELVQKYEAASEQSELKFGLEKVMDTIERFLDAITEQEGCIDEATKDS